MRIFSLAMMLGLASQGLAQERMSTKSQYYLLVLDISGSMADGMLDHVQGTATKLIQKLRKNKKTYSMGLISFSGCGAGTITLHTKPGKLNNGMAILAQMKTLKPNGATALALALQKSLQVIETFQGQGCVKTLILTDGSETCGGDPSVPAARIRAHDNACDDAIELIYLGHDALDMRLNDEFFDQEGSQTHQIDTDQKMELGSVMEEIFEVESHAELGELKKQSVGGRKGGPGGRKKRRLGKNRGKNEDPKDKDKTGKEVESGAEAKEKKYQKKGRGGGGAKK